MTFHFDLLPSGVNPARAFGSAFLKYVIAMTSEAKTATFDANQWLYWAGPMVGAAFAVLVQKALFGRVQAQTPHEQNHKSRSSLVQQPTVHVNM